MNRNSASMALGGIMASLAVTVMCLCGLIPVATYVCPVICTVLLQVVLNACGKRVAWAWYGAVSILSLLMSSDKEAAFTFCFLGYYPIVKPFFDSRKAKWLLKALLFNASIAIMYWFLLRVLGLQDLSDEFGPLNKWMILLLFLLGNVSFFLLDVVLNKDFFRKLGKHG